MSVLVLFKSLGDMAMYYTLAGSIAALFGCPPGALWLSLFLAGLALTLSYLLRERGFVRYAPFLALPPLTAWGGPAALLALLPALGYGLWQARRETYQPDRGQQTELFSLFWKVLLALTLGGILYGKGEGVSRFTLPCGGFAVVCSVLLLRSLRHDSAVYEDRRYQLTNLLSVALAALGALALGSGPLLALCSRSLGAIYRTILVPLLSALLWCIGMVVYSLIQFFVGLLDPSKKENPTPMPDFGAGFDQLQELQESVETGAFWWELLLALGAIAVAVVIFLFLRRLARSRSREGGQPAPGRERRSYAPPLLQTGEEPAQEGRAVRRVRREYRRFLRLCLDRRLPLTHSQTSDEVDRLAREKLDGARTGELRRLYLRARYAGLAQAQDAQRARELVDGLKKEG